MEAPGDALVLAVTTAPDAAQAERLAEALVRERLVACANLLPGAVSVYRWEGEVRKDAEVVMLMKTRRARVGELERRLAALHPYEVPELIVLPIQAGLPAYCRWVAAETSEA